jgi:tetratricopeptide (TPR) repeat protein
MEDSKTSEKPLSPEIAKLTEKLASDPKSRLFVPLAEEYIKSGMLDEAQSVLEDGLKIHPNFMSAKTTLGKVYFEKGQHQDAKILFEELIASNPENFFAHRRLARIYHEEGRTEAARKSCNAVLAANPKDEEMNALMEALERGPSSQAETAAAAQPAEVSTQLEPTARAADSETGVSEEKAPAAQGFETTRLSSEPEPSAPFEPTVRIKVDEVAPTASPAEPPAPPESKAVSEEVSGAIPEPPPPAAPETSAAERVEEKSFAWSGEEPVSASALPAEGDLATESLGDLYIKQGYYDKGKEIYRKILARDPSHSGVRRKLEETESLLSILSKSESAQPDRAPGPASPPEPEPAPPAGQEAAASGEGRLPSDKRVKRLEAWLESLRKGQQK